MDSVFKSSFSLEAVRKGKTIIFNITSGSYYLSLTEQFFDLAAMKKMIKVLKIKTIEEFGEKKARYIIDYLNKAMLDAEDESCKRLKYDSGSHIDDICTEMLN